MPALNDCVWEIAVEKESGRTERESHTKPREYFGLLLPPTPLYHSEMPSSKTTDAPALRQDQANDCEMENGDGVHDVNFADEDDDDFSIDDDELDRPSNEKLLVRYFYYQR